MAYCRWSDCDVYVYEDVNGGWTTHVAGRRNVAGNAPLWDMSSEDAFAASVMARSKWYKENQTYEDIDLPNAGKSFNDPTPGQCADRLEALKAEGFDVPQYAIDELREEQATFKEAE